jgi:UDP-2,3-diacylglucosamine hydrolase
MQATTPPIAELKAPANWQVVDFISDLHLQASESQTVRLWEHYMANTRANAVFILGDLFDVWVGDDAIAAPKGSVAIPPSFETRCARTLEATSQRCDLFFMHGNRDFLFGVEAASQCQLRLLDDPTVLSFQDQRWLLTHGDALCLEDTAYQQFRSEVRSAQWQQAFLAKPLTERRAIAQGLRTQSEAKKRAATVYADVDTAAALAWMEAAKAMDLIHGHTHRPADQTLAEKHWRHVLSDWDGAVQPERMQVLRLSRNASDPLPALQRISSPAAF